MMLLYGRSFVFDGHGLNREIEEAGSMRIQSSERLARTLVTAVATLAILAGAGSTRAPARAGGADAKPGQPQLVWVDTDIGDDIDDAFALGLILHSPELHVLGISTAFGDTETRARLVDRFLAAAGEAAIPVTAGVHTETDNVMTQRTYAEHYPARAHADGVAELLREIKRYPGEITVIAIGPLFNIGAAIDRDPETFKKLKRVVMMGGSINRGYDGANGELRPPDAEWNINRDPKDAAKLLASGVPIYMMPLDSTQIHLETAAREAIFAAGNPITDQLTLLYPQWVAHTQNHSPTPTLFDPVAAAYTSRPDLCPMQPMRIEVDEKGFTRKAEGTPNVQVCLRSDEAGFLKLLEARLVR
jgi:inosine-uridine nucleoside N-ribohydrolase